MAHNGTRRELAAIALARGLAVARAVEESGVPLRTLRRWLAEDVDFQQRVDELRNELVSQTVGRVTDAAGLAAETLVQLLASSDERVRLQAARISLGAFGSMRPMQQVSQQLAALEQLLAKGGQA